MSITKEQWAAVTEMSGREIVLSALTGTDGTINPGYLVLFRSGRAVIIVIFLMVSGSFLEMGLSHTHTFRVDVLGIAIGAVLGAYGLVLGGIAAYLWGDSHGAPPPPSPTMSASMSPSGDVKMTAAPGPQPTSEAIPYRG